MTKKKPPRVRIPVKYVDGVWKCALGGPVPVTEGAEAEIVISRANISDAKFLNAMETKGKHKILGQGAKLLICVTIRSEFPLDSALASIVRRYSDFRDEIATQHISYWNPETIGFVEVSIDAPNKRQSRLLETTEGGLWLLTEGPNAVGLASTTVRIPQPISAEPVATLNYAYTLLSERIETWRMAHTGNVYERVLYKEKDGRWYPLDKLRHSALDGQELVVLEKS